MIVHAAGESDPEAGTTGRLLAPHGRYEFAPLRLVDVDQADVQVLAAAARGLGDPHAHELVRDGLEQGRRPSTPETGSLPEKGPLPLSGQYCPLALPAGHGYLPLSIT
ncbi:hypothetical protein AB0L53_30720 [Nonomuraea sp. NPDC052129]|uniref:hypothetical protein n=1 Tax=Nonomuraea sp. NPDC052129 TaxID=3154651 RepID=UPI00342BD091